MSAMKAPDHYIELEVADLIHPLPRRRHDFIAAAYAASLTRPAQARELRPERIGFQPYITNEVWERLKAAMREYRDLNAKHEDTKPVEAAILFYAGWLGHYVGDGAQPLHVTVQYNGWTGPNPNGYTTAHQIHHIFEGVFVADNMHDTEVQARMTPLHKI